jgi:hypothetical protein
VIKQPSSTLIHLNEREMILGHKDYQPYAGKIDEREVSSCSAAACFFFQTCDEIPRGWQIENLLFDYQIFRCFNCLSFESNDRIEVAGRLQMLFYRESNRQQNDEAHSYTERRKEDHYDASHGGAQMHRLRDALRLNSFCIWWEESNSTINRCVLTPPTTSRASPSPPP